MYCAALLTIALAAGPTVPSRNFGPDLQRLCRDCTVRVRDVAGQVQGSGFVFGRKDEYLFALTANHIFTRPDGSRADKICVEGFAGSPGNRPSTRPMRAIPVIWDEAADLALIKFIDFDLSRLLPLAPFLTAQPTGGRFPAARLIIQNGSNYREEEFPVLSVGCGGGNRPTCREDTVLAKRLVFRNDRPVAFFWETRGETSAGRSGGPLFDATGNVIGVCTAKQAGLGYYAHAEEINRFLKKGNFGWLQTRSSDTIPNK